MKVKEIIQKWKRKIMVAVVAAMVVCTAVVPCLAAEPTSPDVNTIMTGAATDLVAQLSLMIAAVLAAVLSLYVLKIGITYGLRFIKQLIGKAS